MIVSLCETIEHLNYDNMRHAGEDGSQPASRVDSMQGPPSLDINQIVDIFLTRNPTVTASNSQESLHSALDNTDALEHKMLDSESVGRGYFGGGMARARFNSHDSSRAPAFTAT